jgi:hypothetical protein
LDFEIAAPEPAGLVASIGSLGYSVQDAVADLVDNSVAAGAANVEIDFTWDGSNSWVSVVDDGVGMSEDRLRVAMTVAGGWNTTRATTDLGRFGMGLKSASFSQSRLVTVSTCEDGAAWVTRTWDLDHIAEVGEWRLLQSVSPATEALLGRLRNGRARGTVVLWQSLTSYRTAAGEDARARRQFYDDSRRVSDQLGVTFGRYLTRRDPLVIVVDGEQVAPWDPFLVKHESTMSLPPEQLELSGHIVRVQPYILPPLRRLSEDETRIAAGARGWQRQQGFYVYRRDRLISVGGWLGLRGLRTEERYNLARIAIDVPAESDAMWSVDVRKAKVTAPVALRDSLMRVAQYARKHAAENMRRRGRIASRQHDANLFFAWKLERNNGVITCRINREHPAVVALLESTGGQADQVDAVLRLIEETVPITGLRALHEPDTPDDPDPFDDATAEAGSDAVARRMLDLFMAAGRSRSEALGVIRQTHPFDQMTGFWSEADDEVSTTDPLGTPTET